MMNTLKTDILVIGGGPAGSTIATLLAQKGWEVTLIDKDQHPRFHIGESLLPLNLNIFEKLGLLEKIQAISVKKPGAEFVDDASNQSKIIYFSRALDCQYPHAFQVKRDEFDQLLLENTKNHGVEIHEKNHIKSVDFSKKNQPIARGTDAQNNSISWQARYIIDATGNKALLANQFKIKKPHKKHQSAAIFAHFTNIPHRKGLDAGNITLYWFKFGWFWVIPLPNGLTSVGAVCWPDYLKSRKNSIEDFFFDTINQCASLKQRMQHATLTSKVNVTGNFSYTVDRFGGEDYLKVGDALAFIDPVFSSGVLLAMHSACKGAELVDQSLKHPEKAKKLLKSYEKEMRAGLKQFSWFIFRSNSPALRHMMLNPRNYFNAEQGIVSLLAGDVFNNKKVNRALFFFKFFYYFTSLQRLSLEIHAYFRRRKNAKADFVEPSN